MVQVDPKHYCVFCGEQTGFEDKGKYYCIDCYVKLRNSAHTHTLPVNPEPITPQYWIDNDLPRNMFIC